MPDISLNVDLKVQEALSELKRLAPTADKESKAIAASLGRALKDAEKAAKKTSDELDRGMKKSAGSVDAAGKAAVKLRGILGSISPEAAGAAGAVDDAVDALEALEIGAGQLGVSVAAAGAALAVVTLAVGAGAMAWAIWSEEGRQAAEVSALVSAASEKLTPLIDATRMAQLDAAVATGAMTEAAAKLEREGIASMKAFGAATADTTAQIKALHDGAGTLSRTVGDLGDYLQGTPMFGLGLQIDMLTESSSEAQVKIDALMQGESDAAGIVKQGTEARKASTEATARHAATTVNLTDALLKEAAAAQASADKFAAHLAAVEADAAAADAIVTRSGEFRMSEIDKLQAAEDAAAGQYVASAQAGSMAAADIAAGESAIRANYQEQITAKVEEESAKRAATEQAHLAETAAAQAASFAATIGTINQVSGYASDALGMLGESADAAYQNSADTVTRLNEQMIAGEAYYTDAQKEALSKRTDAAKDAARKQFAAAKAAKIAEATASTALAIINAIAQSPPPSPFGLIGAGIAGAAGAVVIGQIASTEPSFHQGYAPDEMKARVLKNESVLSPTATAAVGAGRVSELNAGKTGRAYSGPAPVIIDHKTMNTLIKREIANGGALASALSSGSVVGHRANRRGTSG